MPAGDLSWQEDAACRSHPEVRYFYDLHGAPTAAQRAEINAALDVCATCPVTGPCLELGLAHSADVVAGSVWGGVYLSQRGTRRMQQERAAA